MVLWEFYKGLVLINAGKRRNGKPHTVITIETFRVMSESDAKALIKAYPELAGRARKVTAEKSEKWPPVKEMKR